MHEWVVPDSRYVPMVQQEFCAAPACISMAMLRRGIPLVPQELIAYKLGLTLSREHVESARFFNPRVADDQLIDRPTILPHEPEYHPGAALASLHIPLRFQFVSVSAMTPALLFNFLLEVTGQTTGHTNEDADPDILFCFSPLAVWPAKPAGGQSPGVHRPDAMLPSSPHLCLLDQIERGRPAADAREGEGWRARVIDPAPGVGKWRKVSGEALLKGMQALGDDYMGGLWLLTSSQSKTPSHAQRSGEKAGGERGGQQGTAEGQGADAQRDVPSGGANVSFGRPPSAAAPSCAQVVFRGSFDRTPSSNSNIRRAGSTTSAQRLSSMGSSQWAAEEECWGEEEEEEGRRGAEVPRRAVIWGDRVPLVNFNALAGVRSERGELNKVGVDGEGDRDAAGTEGAGAAPGGDGKEEAGAAAAGVGEAGRSFRQLHVLLGLRRFAHQL